LFLRAVAHVVGVAGVYDDALRDTSL